MSGDDKSNLFLTPLPQPYAPRWERRGAGHGNAGPVSQLDGLGDTVRQALQAVGGPGSEVVALVELIKLYAVSGVQVTLGVRSLVGKKGWIALADGNVVGARTLCDLAGVSAFVDILSWDSPTVVETKSGEVCVQNIDLPLSRLLVETYWRSFDPGEPILESAEDDAILAGLLGVEVTTLDAEAEATIHDLLAIEGAIAIAILSAQTGAWVRTAGEASRLTLTSWLPLLVTELRQSAWHQVAFTSGSFVDVLVPGVGNSPAAYLLRADRTLATSALLQRAVRRILFGA